MSNQLSKNLFKPGSESAEILRAWWKSLEDNRGERARLRRAPNPSDVAFSPAYHRLFNQLLGLKQLRPINREPLEAVAGLISHVREDTGPLKKFAQQMGAKKTGSDNAIVSGLRFRRILAISDRNTLYPMLLRIIHLLGGKVNLLSLAESVYLWNERTWKDWAYEYYAAAPKEK